MSHNEHNPRKPWFNAAHDGRVRRHPSTSVRNMHVGTTAVKQERVSAPDTEVDKKSKPISQKAQALGAGAILAAVGALYLLGGGEYKTTKTEERVKSLRSVDRVRQEIVVLKAGSKLRLTPHTQNGHPENQNPNNIEMEVEKGKEIEVFMPLEDADSRQGWIAFTLPEASEEIKSIRDRAEQIVWANADSLETQGYAMRAPIDATSDGAANVLKARIGESGEIKTFDPSNNYTYSSIDENGKFVERDAGVNTHQGYEVASSVEQAAGTSYLSK
jgi:hypothetical protein